MKIIVSKYGRRWYIRQIGEDRRGEYDVQVGEGLRSKKFAAEKAYKLAKRYKVDKSSVYVIHEIW